MKNPVTAVSGALENPGEGANIAILIAVIGACYLVYKAYVAAGQVTSGITTGLTNAGNAIMNIAQPAINTLNTPVSVAASTPSTQGAGIVVTPGMTPDAQTSASMIAGPDQSDAETLRLLNASGVAATSSDVINATPAVVAPLVGVPWSVIGQVDDTVYQQTTIGPEDTAPAPGDLA